MQNIFEKIDTMFSGENDDKPVWAVDILNELKSIRVLLEQNNRKVSNTNSSNNNEYYDFINKFRASMRADVDNDIFPYILYHNRKLGVNFKGYLYDKDKSTTLSSKEAFDVYKYIYENKPKIIA